MRSSRGRQLGGHLAATGTQAPFVRTSTPALDEPAPFEPVTPSPRNVRAWGRRVEIVAVLAASVAIFAIYAWSGQFWLDLIDEGYFVYLGSRVHAGDLPYRDFDSYYTPGIFYLFAWTFDLFGVSVEPIRFVMSGVRVLWALVLYGLTRRVAPWPFAWVPFLVVAAVDATPIFPEPHPSWPSMLATFAVVEAVARHQAGGNRRWLVVAGTLAGVSFAFKQNVGAFAVLAIGGYVLVYGRASVGRLLQGTRVAYLLLLGVAATVLLWPGLTAGLGVTVWLPLLLTLGLLGWSAWTDLRVDGWTTGLPSVLVDAIAAGAAFVLVTLAWLIPLTIALGVEGVPWGLFVGNVNQGGLILPLDPLPPATRPVALAAIWAPISIALAGGAWKGPARRRLLPVAICTVVASIAVAFLPVGPPYREIELVEDPGFYPWLTYLDDQLGALFTYLPSLGAWAGVVMLTVALCRRAPSRELGWYLLAATLSNLALYPRIDAIHAMFAGPSLLVIGAWALARVHGALVGRSHAIIQVAAFLALLILPLAAVAPHAYWRYVSIVHADPRSPLPPPYVALGLERAPVQLPEHLARSIRGVVELVRAGTPPGAPFFAYPVDPMFNFLADRPNPTRFNHFIAGALTPGDLQEVVDDLERSRPRYVVWDHSGTTYFKTDQTNRVLSDYIWGCYSQVANFAPHLVLERHCP